MDNPPVAACPQPPPPSGLVAHPRSCSCRQTGARRLVWLHGCRQAVGVAVCAVREGSHGPAAHRLQACTTPTIPPAHVQSPCGQRPAAVRTLASAPRRPAGAAPAPGGCSSAPLPAWAGCPGRRGRTCGGHPAGTRGTGECTSWSPVLMSESEAGQGPPTTHTPHPAPHVQTTQAPIHLPIRICLAGCPPPTPWPPPPQ